MVQLQQNIDISVSFALFFFSCANYISCTVTIVSAAWFVLRPGLEVGSLIIFNPGEFSTGTASSWPVITKFYE